MKKNIKLYSAFFPFYGFLTLQYRDVLWMFFANLALILLAVFLVLKLRKAPDWKQTLKKTADRAFATAVLTDAVAIFLRFLPVMVEMLLRLLGFKAAAGFMAMYLSDQAWYHSWASWNAFGIPYTLGCMLVAGVIAFFLGYKRLLKKAVPDKKLRLWLSLAVAVCSTPWSWFNPGW